MPAPASDWHSLVNELVMHVTPPRIGCGTQILCRDNFACTHGDETTIEKTVQSGQKSCAQGHGHDGFIDVDHDVLSKVEHDGFSEVEHDGFNEVEHDDFS